MGSSSDRPSESLGHAAALVAAADSPEARATPRHGVNLAMEAARLALAQGDDRLASQAEALQAWHLVRLGELEAAVASGQRALSRIASQGASSAQSLILSTLSLAYERAGLYSLAVSHAAQALNMAREQADVAAECWALIRMGTAADEDNGQHGLEFLSQALALARGLPGHQAELLFSALNNFSRRLVVDADRLRAEPARARAALEAALPLAEEAARRSGPGFTRATASANLGGICRRLGQETRARHHLGQALVEARERGYTGLAATMELALASLEFQLRPTDEHQATLVQLLDRGAAGVDPDLLLQARRQLVDGCRARGDTVTALDQLERLLADRLAVHARRSDLQSRLLFNQAELDQARHSAERARLAAEVERLRAEAERQTAQRLSVDRDLLEREVAVRTYELQQATATAQAASRAKSTFMSIVSHELRTPLNGMIGMVDVALRAAVDERQTRQLKTALASAKQLGGLITNILDYVNADTSRPAALTALDLRALLHAAVEARAAEVQAKGLVIAIDCDEALPSQVRVDGNRLHQILAALLDNAVKFSDPGIVRVDVRWQTSFSAPPQLHLSVADTGPGLAPEVLQRLFQPFEPGDGSLTRTHGGLGMGLALAQRLAQSLAGDVGAEPNPPAGTRFWVRLPVAPPIADAGA